MTILQKQLQSGDGHAARGWHGFGHGAQAVRYPDASEHETFAEEQARWERSDLEHARICEQVRHTKKRGGEASRCADAAKAEWDARVATQRQANDDAQRADHGLKAVLAARSLPPTSRIMPEPVRVHDEPTAPTRAASSTSHAPVFVARPTRNPVSNESARLEVELWLLQR